VSVSEEKAIPLRINGEAGEYRAGDLQALVTEYGLDPARRGLACALNGEVVPRKAWLETSVQPGDKVEIVQPLAGG
jgi:sulfur carrier protein